MNIKDSKFYSNDTTVQKLLTASFFANNDIKGITTHKYIVNRQINKIKKLNSSSSDESEGTVNSVDDPIDYRFDESVFEVINDYMSRTKISYYKRCAGFVKFYSIGFFEDWKDRINKVPDLIEGGPPGKRNPNIDPNTAHNIYDDLVESINKNNETIKKDLTEIIRKSSILKSKEQVIIRMMTNNQLKIRTADQLRYFIDKMKELLGDTQELADLKVAINKLRNKYAVKRDITLIKEFIKDYPNYITYDYYKDQAYQFVNDLYRMLPNSTAIAINKNTYGLCGITL